MTTITVVAAGVISTLGGDPSTVITAAMIVAISSGTVTTFAFPAFQRFVEAFILGVPAEPPQLLERYSSRIATTLSIDGLVRLLRDEIPSL